MKIRNSDATLIPDPLWFECLTLASGAKAKVNNNSQGSQAADDFVIAYHCIDCNEDLCEACNQAHKIVKLTRNHTIKTIKIISSDVNESALKICSGCDENVPASYFCENCNENYLWSMLSSLQKS